MDTDYPIEYSRHCQDLTMDGHTLRVDIYRGDDPDEGWILEVVNAEGTSTVWQEPFDTDDEAMAELRSTLAEEGVGPLVAPIDDDET